MAKKITKRTKKINKKTKRRIKNKSKYSKSKKYTTYKKYKKIGGADDTVKCCMCGKEMNINDGLIPRKCLNMHGLRGHRICKKCWFDPEIGFAREDISHECPGCKKNLPLTNVETKNLGTIDLTEDDD
jgi:hypothetical protein